jgi:hypothetical protein
MKLLAALLLSGLLIVSVVGLFALSEHSRAGVSEDQPYAGTSPPDLPLGVDGDGETRPTPVLTR